MMLRLFKSVNKKSKKRNKEGNLDLGEALSGKGEYICCFELFSFDNITLIKCGFTIHMYHIYGY